MLNLSQLTFLTLVEDGRAWMVHAFLALILVRFAAAFVDALLRHVWGVQVEHRAKAKWGDCAVFTIVCAPRFILELGTF